MKRVMLAVALHAVISATCASAQGNTAPLNIDAKAPTFDIVSIKPNKSGASGSMIKNGGDSFSATDVSVENMLINAYSFGALRYQCQDRRYGC